MARDLEAEANRVRPMCDGGVFSLPPGGILECMRIGELPLTPSSRPCRSVCGVGSAEIVLLKRVLGLCLRLRLVVSGDCSRATG